MGLAIAVDSGGSAYVAGMTNTPDFPTTPGVIKSKPALGESPLPFLAKFKPDGSDFAYSTYLGSKSTGILALALDAAGNAYVTGSNIWGTFPTKDPLQEYSNNSDVVVAKVNTTGTALLFSHLPWR